MLQPNAPNTPELVVTPPMGEGLSEWRADTIRQDWGREVGRRAKIAAHITDMGVDLSAISQMPAGDWGTLSTRMDDWAEKTFAPLREDYGRVPEGLSPVEAAIEGIHTVIAVLEVIARVLYRQEFEQPNAQIAVYARHSQGFIGEWAGLDSEVDYQLAYALAAKKPPLMADVFKGLRFNPRFFAADLTRHCVTLDRTKTPNLQGRPRGSAQGVTFHDTPRGRKRPLHPQGFMLRARPLIGCVARRVIPSLYQSVAEAAGSNRLFEATYLGERRRYDMESVTPDDPASS